MHITHEIFEEEEQNFKSMAEKLKRNREQIKKEDRTGTGRYAKAYQSLKNQVYQESVKYAIYSIKYCIEVTPKLEPKVEELLREVINDVVMMTRDCQWAKLDNLLEKQRAKFLNYVFPRLEKAV